MLNWLKRNIETASGNLGLTELSRLKSMREDSATKSGRNRDLVAQGRSTAFMVCSRESRNRAIGYWFLRGGSYTPDFVLETGSLSEKLDSVRFAQF